MPPNRVDEKEVLWEFYSDFEQALVSNRALDDIAWCYCSRVPGGEDRKVTSVLVGLPVRPSRRSLIVKAQMIVRQAIPCKNGMRKMENNMKNERISRVREDESDESVHQAEAIRRRQPVSAGLAGRTSNPALGTTIFRCIVCMLIPCPPATKGYSIILA